MSLIVVRILGTPIVKKNGKRIVRRGKFPKLIDGDAFQRWEAAALTQAAFIRKWDGPYPIYAHYGIYMPDRRKFDLTNMVEGINDVMQEAGIIRDDDFKSLIPIFHGPMCGVFVDAQQPRIVVTIADEPMTE